MTIILNKTNKQNSLPALFIFLYFLFLLMLIWHTLEARGEINGLSVGARALSMGDAYTGVAEGPEAIFFNPAGLSQSAKPAFSFFISRLYNLKELTYQNLSAVFPSPYGSFSISLQTFGHTLYRENLLTFGWGDRYGKKIYYGILVSKIQIQIQKYGAASTFLFDGGILFRLDDKTKCGIAVANFNQGKIGSTKEKVPQIIRVGFSTMFFPDVLFSIEIDKEQRFPLQLKGGCEMRPLHNFNMRCGFGRKPSYFSAGIGLVWENLSFDYGFTSHLVLGITHYISITLNFGYSKRFKNFTNN